MMMSLNVNIFRVTGPLWGESTGHRCIPLTKASDAELWYFHCNELDNGRHCVKKAHFGCLCKFSIPQMVEKSILFSI